jgi:hypothetical protein
MTTRATVFILLTLSLAPGAAFAQSTPTTGIVASGTINLVRSEGKIPAGSFGPIDSTTDVFSGVFQSIDFSQFTPPPSQVTSTTVGACAVTTLIVPVVPNTTPSAGVTPLDAGPVLNVNGPNGFMQFPQNISTPFQQNSPEYSGVLGGGTALPIPGLPAPPPLYLAPGVYNIDNGGGGADVGPFQATLTVPSPIFSWTNADANLTINRAAGVDLQWAGGDPTTQVNITGSVIVIDPSTFQITSGGGFMCTANNSDGHFTLTPAVLSLMPATVASPSQPGSNITVSSAISAPISASGVAAGSLVFQVGNTRTVTFQ